MSEKEMKLPYDLILGPFKPHAWYNEGLDCLVVHLVNASSTEHELNDKISVGTDHGDNSTVHYVHINNPSQYLPEIAALNNRIKELEEHIENISSSKLMKENHNLGFKIDSLTERLGEIEPRLKAYEEGVPPSEADKGRVYYIEYRGAWHSVSMRKSGIFVYDTEDRAEVQVYPPRLYPLPQQKEESE